MLLTARQVAERIGVSPETVLRWTRRGDLAAIRLPGNALRYDPAHLDAWLAQRGTLPTSPPPKDTIMRPAPELPRPA